MLPTAHAQASSFPNRPIRILCGSAAATLTDQAARLYAEKMSAYLKQPVVVENVVGAASLIAVRQLLRSPADGYTLVAAANTVVMVPHINPKAGYTVKELAGIGEMVRSPTLVVTGGASPYKSLKDLIAAAKAAPDQITYGSSGVGTTNHLSTEMLARQAGVRFSHVPYKGISAAVPDVAAGRVGFVMAASNSVGELLKSGALRALAISSDARSPQFPDVPSLKELGYPGATSTVWIGLVAQAGIPEAVKARLGDAMEAARNDPDVIQRLTAAGQEISNIRTPAQFDATLRSDEEKYGKLIREAHIATD